MPKIEELFPGKPVKVPRHDQMGYVIGAKV